jgi:AhpD family alkylhydroperoxidase
MQPRKTSPVPTAPGVTEGLRALAKTASDAAAAAGVPRATLELVGLRASQINGCAVCLDMHSRGARKAGESDERLATVAAWRETPYFSEAERAALALAEAGTRLADRPDPVPGELLDEAARHYDGKALGALIAAIAVINTWNRLNVMSGHQTGEWVAQWIA